MQVPGHLNFVSFLKTGCYMITANLESQLVGMKWTLVHLVVYKNLQQAKVLLTKMDSAEFHAQGKNEQYFVQGKKERRRKEESARIVSKLQ